MSETQIIVDPVLRQRMAFSTTHDDDGTEVLHVETWLDPGGGVTPHVHPAMEERFEVLEGTVSFLAGRHWTPYPAGQTAVVPAGTRHAYRNDADATAHMVCHVRPPSTLQSFLEDAAALGRAGLTTRQAMPKSPRALMIAAVVAEANFDMVTLGFPPLPPKAVQRLVVPPLAALGRRRGYRAGEVGQRLGV
jgi:quercetin dioxygenase-like cupin family protein